MRHAEANRKVLFPGPIMGGYECASHVDKSRRRQDYLAITGHEQQFREDYERAIEAGIRTIREGLRWHLIDRGGKYDFSSIELMVEAAVELGITHINCLFHYGYPDDLNPLTAGFVSRFRDFAAAFAQWRLERVPAPRWYGIVNERSMFSYAAGEPGWFAPFQEDKADELKVNLARAAIAGTDAIRQEDPEARFVVIDPIVQVAPRHEDPADNAKAGEKNEGQYLFWDMLSGRENPEMGGRPGYVDVIGVNAYPDSYFDLDGKPLPDGDARRRPLHHMLIDVWERYRRPIMMAETSARGRQRPQWIRMVADECVLAIRAGVDFRGVCVFPLVDMPEWKYGEIGPWGLLGLWDIVLEGDSKRRVLNEAYFEAVQEARATLKAALHSETIPPPQAPRLAATGSNGAKKNGSPKAPRAAPRESVKT